MRISRAGTWTSHRTHEHASAQAFTLVELIVVLMVLGISATLVFPKLSGLLLREPEPWRSGRKLARLVKCGRELAAATESTFVLSLDVNTGDYWVTSQPQDEGPPLAKASSDLRGRLGEEVRVADIEVAGEGWDPEAPCLVKFSPEGWCDPVTVHLISSEGRMVSVVIGEWFDEIDLIEDNSAG